jgi:hypothetical protein
VTKLKAQIARIEFSTELTVGGVHKVNPQDEDDKNPQEITPIEEDELKPLGLEEKFKLENWQHFSQAILKEGRITHTEIEEEDEDKKKALTAQKLADDPLLERLKPISKDRCMPL